MREPAVHLGVQEGFSCALQELGLQGWVELWQVCQGREHREGHTSQQEGLGRGMVGLKNKAGAGDT